MDAATWYSILAVLGRVCRSLLGGLYQQHCVLRANSHGARRRPIVDRGILCAIYAAVAGTHVHGPQRVCPIEHHGPMGEVASPEIWIPLLEAHLVKPDRAGGAAHVELHLEPRDQRRSSEGE